MGLSINLNRQKVQKDGTCAVRLNIQHNGREKMPLGFSVSPEQWNDKTRRVRPGHRSAALYNSQIVDLLSRAEVLILKEPLMTAQQIASRLGASSLTGFIELARADLKEHPPKSWFTIKQRGWAIDRLERYASYVRPEQITIAWVKEYKAHLEAKGNKPNTVATQLRFLRTIYRRVCKRIGMAPLEILQGLDATEKYADVPEMCSPEEILRLKEYADHQKGWAAKAVHMWLFSLVAAGIRWTDLCLLSRENLRDGRLSFVMRKTGKIKNVELHPMAKDIMARYPSPLLFDIAQGRVPTDRDIASKNVVANKFLKVAAKACGIDRRLHTHNARHSFAALALWGGMDDRAIQQLMGIDDKAFKHYRARFSQPVLDQAMKKVLQGLEV